jgi:hypothetical protein
MGELQSQRLLDGEWPVAADVGLGAEHWTEIPRKTYPPKLEECVMAATEPVRPYYRPQTFGAQLVNLAGLTGAPGGWNSIVAPRISRDVRSSFCVDAAAAVRYGTRSVPATLEERRKAGDGEVLIVGGHLPMGRMA